MRLDPVGPEAILDQRAVLGEQLSQLDESERPRHVLHVEDVAGRVVGRGGRTSLSSWGGGGGGGGRREGAERQRGGETRK